MSFIKLTMPGKYGLKGEPIYVDMKTISHMLISDGGDWTMLMPKDNNICPYYVEETPKKINEILETREFYKE